jgi:transcriptional regulator with XRE-family HTH domain
MPAFSQIMRELDELKVRRRFGDRVRSLRKGIGISQEELALIAGLDRTYIGGVERGERNISLVNIHRLAAALNVPPRDLF